MNSFINNKSLPLFFNIYLCLLDEEGRRKMSTYLEKEPHLVESGCSNTTKLIKIKTPRMRTAKVAPNFREIHIK